MSAAELADHVYDHMAEIARDDDDSGFIVHRHATDGSAAVTFRPGMLDAYTYVLRLTLTGWAEQLRNRGFTVEVQARDDRGDKAVPQWLRVTGWDAAAVIDEAGRPKFGDLLESVAGERNEDGEQGFRTSATDPTPCACHSCKKGRRAAVRPDVTGGT